MLSKSMCIATCVVATFCYTPKAFCQLQPVAFEAAGKMFFAAFDAGDVQRLAATMGPNPQAGQIANAWVMLPRRDFGIATKREFVGLSQFGQSVVLEYRTVFSRPVNPAYAPQQRKTPRINNAPSQLSSDAGPQTETGTKDETESDSTSPAPEALAANQSLCREMLELAADPRLGVIARRYFVIPRPNDEPLTDAEKLQRIGQQGLMWMGKPYKLP